MGGDAGVPVARTGLPFEGPATIRQSNNRIAGELQALNISPLQTLAATRQMIVIFVTATLLATAWFAMRLFGTVEGLIGALILATDPYHVALSRLLHLDGLESSMLTLAALAWLTYCSRVVHGGI